MFHGFPQAAIIVEVPGFVSDLTGEEACLLLSFLSHKGATLFTPHTHSQSHTHNSEELHTSTKEKDGQYSTMHLIAFLFFCEEKDQHVHRGEASGYIFSGLLKQFFRSLRQLLGNLFVRHPSC